MRGVSTMRLYLMTHMMNFGFVGKETNKAGSALKLSFLASLNPSRWARMNVDRYKVIHADDAWICFM